MEGEASISFSSGRMRMENLRDPAEGQKSNFVFWCPEERAFHTCNLRKSYGFHMVAQGADPIPPVADATPPYRIQVIKCGAEVAFSINELPIFNWRDDGISYGPVLGGGKIGLRQMAPLVGEYANLIVRRVGREGK